MAIDDSEFSNSHKENLFKYDYSNEFDNKKDDHPWNDYLIEKSEKDSSSLSPKTISNETSSNEANSKAFPLLNPPISEKERKAKEAIEKNKFDHDAWHALASEAQNRPVSDPSTVALWEYLLSSFPSYGKWWRIYADMHLSASNFEKIKQIFKRCLPSCPHLELWRCYIRYVKKISLSGGVEGREDVRKAMEYALKHIGLDINAGVVWSEYISFLKTTPVAGAAEDAKRMGSVRRAYQRAVIQPIIGVHQLWKDYEAFENSLSKALAKGLLSEYQPKHLSAMAVLRERKRLMEEIDFDFLPTPGNSAKEEVQCIAWENLLQFERSNPLRLNIQTLSCRVSFAYDQCLLHLRHFAYVWYDYATWHSSNGFHETAVNIFKKSILTLPDDLSLRIAYAEMEEGKGNIKEAKEIYNSMIENKSTETSLAYIQMMRFMRRTEGNDAARKIFLAARKFSSCTFHVYIAAAEIEFAMEKDVKVAKNIFELGLKKFTEEPSLVIEYAEFLQKINDEKNIRALFEKALTIIPLEKSTQVWDKYIELERIFGDLPSSIKIEQRKRMAFAGGGGGGGGVGTMDEKDTSLPPPPMEDMISRYSFKDLCPCDQKQLQLISHVHDMIRKREESKKKTFFSLENSFDDYDIEIEKESVINPESSSLTPLDSNVQFSSMTSSMTTCIPLSMPSSITPSMPSSITPTQSIPPSMPPSTPSSITPPLTTSIPSSLSSSIPYSSSKLPQASGEDNLLDLLPPSIAYFLEQLSPISGPCPDADYVISILLQTDFSSLTLPNEFQAETNTKPKAAPERTTPTDYASISKIQAQTPSLPRSLQAQENQNVKASTEDVSLPPRPTKPSTFMKRKDIGLGKGGEAVAQGKVQPKDIFRMRQLKKAKTGTSSAGGGSNSGTFSGERMSGSSG